MSGHHWTDDTVNTPPKGEERTSWWLNPENVASRAAFDAAVKRERTGMERGKFGRILRPSALELKGG